MADHTPLTEPQARALALWWGGRYLRLEEIPQGAGGPGHAVIVAGFAEPVWSREQAGKVEAGRPEFNPAAIDWVG